MAARRPAPTPAGAPYRVIYYDTQLRFDKDHDESVTAFRVRILTPQALAIGSLSLTWNPASQDVTVNGVRIHRAGTEIDVLPATSPARGKIAAKSGTTVAHDALHGQLLMLTRGNAGYITTRRGRELVFAAYVMYVPLGQVEDLFATAKEIGKIAEIVYERN